MNNPSLFVWQYSTRNSHILRYSARRLPAGPGASCGLQQMPKWERLVLVVRGADSGQLQALQRYCGLRLNSLRRIKVCCTLPVPGWNYSYAYQLLANK